MHVRAGIGLLGDRDASVHIDLVGIHRRVRRDILHRVRVVRGGRNYRDEAYVVDGHVDLLVIVCVVGDRVQTESRDFATRFPIAVDGPSINYHLGITISATFWIQLTQVAVGHDMCVQQSVTIVRVCNVCVVIVEEEQLHVSQIVIGGFVINPVTDYEISVDVGVGTFGDGEINVRVVAVAVFDVHGHGAGIVAAVFVSSTRVFRVFAVTPAAADATSIGVDTEVSC